MIHTLSYAVPTDQPPAARDLRIEVLPLKKASGLLRAINHPLRQSILCLLHQHGEVSVSELYRQLKLEQSVASQHLAILRRAGVALTRREGRQIFYGVNEKRLQQLQDFAAALPTGNHPKKRA